MFKILFGIIFVFFPTSVFSQAANSFTSGSPAPNFTLSDIDNTPVALESFRGKKVILHFWATSCFVCPEEVRALDKLNNKFRDNLSKIITVISFDKTEKLLSKVQQMGLSIPVPFDKENSAAKAYGVRTLPLTFFINEKGGFLELTNTDSRATKSLFLSGPQDWNSEDMIILLTKNKLLDIPTN